MDTLKKCKDMTYHVGIKVRIYPDADQINIIKNSAGAYRFVYNRLVALNNERYRLSKVLEQMRYPSSVLSNRLDYIDSIIRNKNIPLSKAIKNTAPFLDSPLIDSLAIDNAIINYRNAWDNFKKRPAAGIPTFHKKLASFSYKTNAHYYKNKNDNYVSNVRFLDTEHVVLPKIKKIRIAGSKKRFKMLLERDDIRVGSIKISCDACGHYFASFQLASDTPFVDELPKTDKAVGIDLNIENFLWDTNGDRVDNPKYRSKSQKKLAKAQRRMARKARVAVKENRSLKDSKNYQKDRLKVAKLHAHIARQGNDFRHRVSIDYVKNHDIIVAEDLKVKNMLKNHKLAFAISETGWSDFLSKLAYKAEMYRRTFIKVPPHLTTQTCSVCHHVLSAEQRLTLNDREWVCPVCGTYHVRDENAAKNILDKGLKVLASQG